MAQLPGTLAVLSEVPGSISSTHVVAQDYLQVLVLGIADHLTLNLL